MNRLGTFATSTAIAALLSIATAASGQVRPVSASEPLSPSVVAALSGSVDGTVIDDAGLPISGATVSALGRTSGLAITDTAGRFRIRSLPVGAYLVRVHSAGHIPSRRQLVEVRPSASTTISVSLRREDHPTLLAAGIATAAIADPKSGDAKDGDDESEIAWRLRHLKRSVLKDTGNGLVSVSDGEIASSEEAAKGQMARATGLGSLLFNGLPLSGEVNLLTSGSFDAVQQLFSSDSLAQSVASLSLAGPVGDWGDWTIQGIASQGDLGSWFLSGTLKSHTSGAHVYDVNVAYSTQRVSSSAPAPSDMQTAIGDDTRSVGSLYAVDHWRLSRALTLSYSGQYSRYDYLGSGGLLSPRVELAIRLGSVSVRGAASRHMLAPGAEEFLPPIAPGLWVPSQRTFDRVSSNNPMRAERTGTYEVAVDHPVAGGFGITARAFYQQVANQFVALFDTESPGMPAFSHYRVGNVGNLEARGWSLTLAKVATPHLKGSIAYQMTTADWNAGGDAALVSLLAPSAVRLHGERFHDVVTTIETRMPRTNTKVFLLYKVDTAFAAKDPSQPGGSVDGRFDLQVSQPLRMLDFTTAKWQIVFAVRDLFREQVTDGSVYDELLVVRPPKRVVGGLVVRF